ncbi:hypothetical protein ACFU8R_20240 [Pseudonocardia alni]|uniref:hypothetical protein n=1 Tax=Pseudonocardia alni TaxID=33907 RepID=UPI0036CA0A59
MMLADPAWLGYPQVVLAVWAPLVSLSVWLLARPLLARLRPTDRFRAVVATGLAPVLALCVPYLPASPLRQALPWRAPIAWGITAAAGGSGPLAALLDVVVVIVLVSVATSFGLGMGSAVRAWWWVRRVLQPRKVGAMLVVGADRCPPGFGACTVGLFRPRVVVSQALLDSPHGAAVVEHERAHVAALHPLWILLAVCAVRAWWWCPGRRALTAEIRLTAELSADDRARQVVGRAAVASALAAHIDDAGMRAPVRHVPAFADRRLEVEARAESLRAPRRRPGRLATGLSGVLATLVVSAVVVLL